MNILVTGSASCLAKVLLPRLLEQTRVATIVGVDLRPSAIKHEKFQEHLLDIRSPELNTLMQGIDTVIHLAFIVNCGVLGEKRVEHDYIYSINVAGSQHVFELAAQQRVATIIYLSSAVVYGANNTNTSYMTETQPLQTIPGFLYSEHKVAVEQWLDKFEQRPGSPRVVRLRPHVILGANAQPLLKKLLAQPFRFVFPDPQPLTQCVWEEDVATAAIESIFNTNINGSFNLATDEVASFHIIHQHLHKLSIPMPYTIVNRLHTLHWRFSGTWGEPGWMTSMRHNLTIDNQKAQQTLAWRPTLNLFECLEATL